MTGEKIDGMITITATLAPKSAATKGLADNGDGKLKASWEALRKAEDFTWAWVTNFNGGDKKGRLVISKKPGFEGHCIFLPAAGRINENMRVAGYEGHYGSSSLFENSRNQERAYVLGFSLGMVPYLDFGLRYIGYSVRGVLSE